MRGLKFIIRSQYSLQKSPAHLFEQGAVISYIFLAMLLGPEGYHLRYLPHVLVPLKCE